MYTIAVFTFSRTSDMLNLSTQGFFKCCVSSRDGNYLAINPEFFISVAICISPVQRAISFSH
jgi:hypothetical protein